MKKHSQVPHRGSQATPSWSRALRDRLGGMDPRERHVSEAPEPERRGTRRRVVVPIAGGLVALVAMFQLVSANVLAVNFTTGNNTFKVYSNYLDAQSAAGFLGPTTTKGGDQVGVADLGIKTAKLAGLCAIAHEDISIAGIGTTFSLVITAGQSVAASYDGVSVPSGVTVDASGKLSGSSLTGAISAANLFINSNALSGYGNQISGLNLGQSADTVATSAGFDGVPGSAGTWPNGQTAPTAGNFGLYAQQLNVAGLSADTYGLNLAGAITLPKLKIKVVPSAKAQDYCATAAS